MAKVYLFGDSIGQGVTYNPDRKRYCLSRVRCVRQLEAAGLELENHAMMGRTVMEGYREFCQTETEKGGVCVIEFGGNDCDLDWDAVAADPAGLHNGRTPLPEFRAMLELFIRDARRRELQPMLVTPPPLMAGRFCDWVSRGRDGDAILRFLGDVEHIYRWQERYARTIREVAWENGCILADLRGVFLDADDLPSLIGEDGMHPTDAGQTLIARAVLSALPAWRDTRGA